MIRSLILTIFIIIVLAARISWAEGLGVIDIVEENEELDIIGMRNPFVSIFYKAKEIIKTPVEPATQKVNNVALSVAQKIKDAKSAMSGAVKAKPNPPKSLSTKGQLNVRIQGVMWNVDSPVAIIDGDVYGIGDSVQKAQITAINKDGIDVLFSGEKIHVSMD